MTDLLTVPPQPPDPSHLERYVLGLLDEAACEAIEADACAHPDVALAIDEVETRLLDAYVADQLGAAQTGQLERVLGQRPRLRARLSFARALARRGTPVARGRWWRTLAAAAAVLVVVGLWQARSLPRQGDAPQQEQAQAEAQVEAPAGAEPRERPADPPPASPPGADDTSRGRVRSVFAVTLPVGVSRGATTTAIAVPTSSTHVELRIPIAVGDDYPRYTLRVSDARGQEVATVSRNALSAGRTVSIPVERRVLVDGTYDIAVEGLDGQGTPEPLAFLQVRVTGRP